jgi:hypothetical protein
LEKSAELIRSSVNNPPEKKHWIIIKLVVYVHFLNDCPNPDLCIFDRNDPMRKSFKSTETITPASIALAQRLQQDVKKWEHDILPSLANAGLISSYDASKASVTACYITSPDEKETGVINQGRLRNQLLHSDSMQEGTVNVLLAIESNYHIDFLVDGER